MDVEGRKDCFAPRALLHEKVWERLWVCICEREERRKKTHSSVCAREKGRGSARGRWRDREKAKGREAPMRCSMGITESGIRHEKVSERHERVRRPDGYDCHHHHPATPWRCTHKGRMPKCRVWSGPKLLRVYIYVEHEWCLLCMRTDSADHLYSTDIFSFTLPCNRERLWRYNFRKKKGGCFQKMTEFILSSLFFLNYLTGALKTAFFDRQYLSGAGFCGDKYKALASSFHNKQKRHS